MSATILTIRFFNNKNGKQLARMIHSADRMREFPMGHAKAEAMVKGGFEGTVIYGPNPHKYGVNIVHETKVGNQTILRTAQATS